jgi:hypothetical protein
MDGAEVAGTAGTESLTAPNQLVLGAQQTLANFLSGDIAEVQVYNNVLPVQQLANLERALECKYGISTATSLLAPTGLTASAGNRQITLSWAADLGASSYNLWRSTDEGATFQMIATNLANPGYVDANAVNGQTNSYFVAGNDDCGSGVESTAVNVFLPLPALSMSVIAGTALSLSWPGWAADWGLLYATNLTPPVAWFPVTSVITSNAGQFNISVPLTNNACFFRLSAP